MKEGISRELAFSNRGKADSGEGTVEKSTSRTKWRKMQQIRGGRKGYRSQKKKKQQGTTNGGAVNSVEEKPWGRRALPSRKKGGTLGSSPWGNLRRGEMSQSVRMKKKGETRTRREAKRRAEAKFLHSEGTVYKEGRVMTMSRLYSRKSKGEEIPN